MIQCGRVRLAYLSRGRRLRVLEGSPPLGNADLSLEVFGRASETEFGLRLRRAEPGLRLVSLSVDIEGLDLGDRFLANGFQSWSETRLLRPSDHLGGLRFVRPLIGAYGDYNWVRYPGGPGQFHSHWLTYTVGPDGADAVGPAGADAVGPAGAPVGEAGSRRGPITFVGSLNESTAYTVFRADYARGRFWADIDVEGLEPSTGEVVAHIFWAESRGDPREPALGGRGPAAGGPERSARPAPAVESPLLPLVRAFARRLDEVTREDRGATPLVTPLERRPGGWNSWYNYYTHVSQADILAELESLRSLALDYVQIDDGWQREVGDWLEVSPRFSDMKGLASAIRDAGFEPGIWVAPLVAVGRSATARRGWVKPWTFGLNPSWMAPSRPLDLDRAEARDYVRRVGDTFREWGFGLVKADFLGAAAARPWGGRTRAQRMWEAMRLVREAMPGRLIACGVPLASAAGLCDFARLGADTTPSWENGLLRSVRYRERPSSLGMLRTILSRWFMNRTLFNLDPDVFLFGEPPGKSGTLMSQAQRRAVYDVTTTVGGVQFFSDSLAKLPAEAADLVRATFPLRQVDLRDVTEEAPDRYRLTLAGDSRGPFTIDLGLLRAAGG